MAGTDLSITVKLIASPDIELVKELITNLVAFWHILSEEDVIDMVQMLSNEDVIFSLVESALYSMSGNEINDMLEEWRQK